jgi:hypothetical protein
VLREYALHTTTWRPWRRLQSAPPAPSCGTVGRLRQHSSSTILALDARVSAGFIAALFLIAQVCDGLFTYAAVQRFGTIAEGNPLLVTWMALVGPTPALLGAKIVASACGLVLYFCGIHRVLLALTVFYGVAAVGPWLAIFMRI